MKHLIICLLLILTACSAPRQLKNPGNLYSNDLEWPVKIHDGWLTAKTISFGSWNTTSRKNGIAEGMGSFIKSPGNPFNFYVTGNDERILVQTMNTTRVAFNNHSLPAALNDLAPDAPISYTLINGARNEPLKRWEMILKSPTYMELNNNNAAGILRCTDTDIRITAHNRFGKVNSYEKICFEFQYRGQPVAAVIPGEKPRIWVSKDSHPALQTTLAAAIAALLLR
ncbi:hypothetical protein [Chitinophaga solisilvae]|uniref:hypothetical protein n=1 Tax=Chitinophaga solisilvae TaxID=1233460 RepID=UPI00136CB62B|nr:hypothetical protein [Chitinophaga solisilvae]